MCCLPWNHPRLQRERRAEAPHLEQEWVSLGLSWRGAEGKPSWVQPSGAHLGFVQGRQETKLGFLNARHGSEAERQAGGPVRARPTWAGPRGCAEPACLTAGLGFTEGRPCGEGEERVKPTLGSGGGLGCYKQ